MPVLEARDITKTFGAFTALDRVSFSAESGSIHAILGENGAGKTTLMNVLYGLYRPDGGVISLGGKKVSIASPRHALDLGIGMIHQHFMQVESLSVVENVILGMRGLGPFLSLKKHQARIAEISRELCFDIDPKAEIWRMSMGMRQRVEIVKALYRDARILILDEPTSILAPSEIALLMEALRKLASQGKAIIFITHKLNEVFAVSDEITVMRLGKVVAQAKARDVTPIDVSRLMIDRDAFSPSIRSVPPISPSDDVFLEVRNLSARNSRGLLSLKNVSFAVHAGEILGVAGVDGNGQAELAEAIAGLLRPASGEIRVKGVDVTRMSVSGRRHRARLSYVPEDRHATGLVLDLSVAENAAMRDFSRRPFSSRGVMRYRKIRKIAGRWVERYNIRCQSPDQKTRYLSGGNQQKLIFGREVECNPDILVIMQPCKGLDIGAIESVQSTILEQRAKGRAILYISTEMEHILSIADRVAVMYAGEIVGVLERGEATLERIAPMMTGGGRKNQVS
ncbi:ABC transporter ATP-binding protein [Alphaproteobacteria bacterium]|nr:ABC transporter ATP-binding protein [Alphaproteobacteria bacterium]